MSGYELTDSFKRKPLDEEWFLKQLPPIENCREHCVLFELPIGDNVNKPPKPKVDDKKWDSYHAKLPCAIENEYKIKASVSCYEHERTELSFLML